MFFRIPAGALRELARVVFPPLLAALLGAMILVYCV